MIRIFFTLKVLRIDQGLWMAYVLNWSGLWKRVWFNLDFYMENGLNWSGFLHGKCLNWSWFLHGKLSQLIRISTLQMVWIDQDCYMENGLHWSWFLHDKWSELIRVVTWQMVWIDQDYCMANGLNWSGFLHGKWSELMKDFTWQTPYIWADSVEDLGGSFNLRESTHRRFTFMYCTTDEVEPIMEIQQWQKYRFYVLVERYDQSEARSGAMSIAWDSEEL